MQKVLKKRKYEEKVFFSGLRSEMKRVTARTHWSNGRLWTVVFLTRVSLLHCNKAIIKYYYALYSPKCFTVDWLSVWLDWQTHNCPSTQSPMSPTSTSKHKSLSNVSLLNTGILLNCIIIAEFIVELETLLIHFPSIFLLLLPSQEHLQDGQQWLAHRVWVDT